MSQQTVGDEQDSTTDYGSVREEMMTTKGVERSTLDMGDEDHALSGMDSKRQAPVEAVAKNVVDRYDNIKAFYREYLSNAHTACIQRAKYELREAGIDDVDYKDVREVLDRASEEVGYEPVIVVKRNEDPEDYALKIEDNGIGIASETAYAIRDIGLSGWHDDETTNGQFGQGTMAGFLPVDHWGEFDMTTWSVQTDENYRARWKLTDLDKLPGQRGSYGTTFTFPYFTEEAQEIDDYEAVREYAEGMIVPVIYEHYDENGKQDGELSDDWGASYIEDRYADGSPVITVEDQFGKAVWSPDDPDSWDTNLKTFCGYQPIDRNDSGIGINSYSMPSGFDIRVKVENGAIISVPESEDSSSNQSLVGKVPVSKNRYEHLPDHEKDDHVVRGDVPDDAIIAPEPTDDRDRFESKHVSDTMRYYAGKLETAFKQRVGEIFETINGLDDIPDLTDAEQTMLIEGIDEYITTYSQNDAERVADDVEEHFGATIDDIFAVNLNVVKSNFGSNVTAKFARAIGDLKQSSIGQDEEQFKDSLHDMADSVSICDRKSRPSSVSRQSYRTKKDVWELLEMTGDDGNVFMAKTASCARKVALAWELHEDNQVVVVDSYTKWDEAFGWKKLKNLPSRNFAGWDELPDNVDLDDDFLDEWDPAHGATMSSASSNSSLSGSFDDQRAKKRAVKVRRGTGAGSFGTVTGEDLFDALDDDGGTFCVGRKRGFDTLLLFRSTENHTARCGSGYASKKRGVAYARVPDYVFDYLHRADRALTPDEYEDRERNKTIEFDWTVDDSRQSARIVDLDERDVLIKGSRDKFDAIFERGLHDEYIDALEAQLSGYGVDDVRSITYVDSDPTEYREVLNKNGCISVDTKPMMVGIDGGFRNSTSFGYGYPTVTKVEPDTVFFDCVLPDLDRDAPEWDFFEPTMDDEELIEALVDLQEAGGFRSTDSDSVPEWHTLDVASSMKERSHWIRETMDRFHLVTDYDRTVEDE